MKQSASLTLTGIIAAFALSTLSSAQLEAASSYKWTDDQGNVHYSQHPPRDRESERLKIKTPRNTGTPYQAPSSSGGNGNSGSAANNSTNELIEQESRANAEERKKFCENAKKNLKTYQVYSRVKDADGKVRVMSKEERDKGIEQSKQSIKEYCN